MGMDGHGRAYAGAHAPWGNIGGCFLRRCLPTSLLPRPGPAPGPCYQAPGGEWGGHTQSGTWAETVACGMVWAPAPDSRSGRGAQAPREEVVRGLCSGAAGGDCLLLEPGRTGSHWNHWQPDLGFRGCSYGPSPDGSLYNYLFCFKNGFPLGIPFLSPERASVYTSSTLTWDTPLARRTAGT